MFAADNEPQSLQDRAPNSSQLTWHRSNSDSGPDPTRSGEASALLSAVASKLRNLTQKGRAQTAPIVFVAALQFAALSSAVEHASFQQCRGALPPMRAQDQHALTVIDSSAHTRSRCLVQGALTVDTEAWQQEDPNI